MIVFKILNFCNKLFDKRKYKLNKRLYRDQKFLKKIVPIDIVALYKKIEDKDIIGFKHSGNIGDVIYALPIIFAIAKYKKISLYLNLNVKIEYLGFTHPLNDRMLTPKIIEMAKPLLLHQHNIVQIEPYQNQPIDIDLDLFRSDSLDLSKGSIAQWYFWIFAKFYPLAQPWLEVTANTKFGNAIVVARSSRYRQPGISYSFLSKYPEVYFVGLPEEYEDTKTEIEGLKYAPIQNFLEMAAVIKGAKLFIGNQSFPFSLAEALKAKRLLEIYYYCPNVIIEGPNGFSFYFQSQFEYLVAEVYTESN